VERSQPGVALSEETLEQKSREFNPGIYFLLLLSAGLRFWKLNTDLWFDEVIELVYSVRASFAGILFHFPGYIPHIFYDLTAKFSTLVFGESPAALRLPAVLFGILGVWAIYSLARLLVGSSEALIAALLLAVSSHHVNFSQNARGYTMQVFFTAVATGSLLRAAAGNGRLAWATYSAASILNLYAQAFSIFVFIGLSFGYLGRYAYQRIRKIDLPPDVRGFVWASISTASVTLLLYAPIIGGSLTFAAVRATKPDFGPRISAGFLHELLQGLLSGYGPFPVIVALVVCLTGLASLWRRNKFGTALLTLPSGVALVCVAVLHFGAHPRYFIFALPAGLIFLVRGMFCLADTCVGVLRPRQPEGISLWARRVAIMGATIFSLIPLAYYYRYPKQDFSGALAFVEKSRDPMEPLVAVGLAAHAYKVYYAPYIRVGRTTEDIRQFRAQGRPVWLIYTLPQELRDRHGQLLEYIRQNFEEVRRFPGTLYNGTVVVCRAPSTSETEARDTVLGAPAKTL